MKLPKATKLKSGVYRIQLKLGGKSVMVYGQTEAQCRQQANLIKSEHRAGKVVQTKCRYTVSEAIDKYIADRPKLSPSTVRGYRCIQKNVFQSAMPLIADSVDWQKVVDEDDHAPKTIKNAWGFICSVLNHVNIKPPRVTLPQQRKNERPFLQPDQIKPFLTALRGQPCELAALLGLHSLRRSEILDLTYADIDLDRNLIRVRGAAVVDENSKLVHKTTNKNAASTRDVPIMIPRLSDLCKAESKNHDPSDYVVTVHPSTLYHQINAVCKKAGLPQIGCHGLRHTAVSLMYHLQWSPLAAMRVCGFADHNVMLNIYTHLAEADKQKDVADMKNFFVAI